MTVIAEHPLAQDRRSMMSWPVVHLVYREGLGSVFEAMVVKPWAKLLQEGVDSHLLNFTPVGEFVRKRTRQKWEDRIAAIESHHRARFHRLPSPPAQARWLWNDAWVLRRWLGQRFDRQTPFILHCRGPYATDLALPVRAQWPHSKVIFDMRGLLHAEHLYEHGQDMPALALLEQRVARSADAVICVSRAMADYVNLATDIHREEIAVIPCCVDTDGPDLQLQRNRIRRELGLTDKFVVAYCGGSQRWQLPITAAELFKQICRLRPESHYLALAHDVSKMRHILDQCGITREQSTVKSVPHLQVAHYLAAADVGLLLREPHLINAVASPVKFGEFMASSVPVIISPNVGDYSDLVRQAGVGMVFDSGDRLDPFRQWSEMRDRCRALAREHLSLDRYTSSVMDLYQRLQDR